MTDALVKKLTRAAGVMLVLMGSAASEGCAVSYLDATTGTSIKALVSANKIDIVRDNPTTHTPQHVSVEAPSSPEKKITQSFVGGSEKIMVNAAISEESDSEESKVFTINVNRAKGAEIHDLHLLMLKVDTTMPHGISNDVSD